MASRNVVLVESSDLLASVARVDPDLSSLSHHLPGTTVRRLSEQTAGALVEMLSSAGSDHEGAVRPEAGTVYVVSMFPDLRDRTADLEAVIEDFARLGDLLAAAGACLVIVGVSTYQADDDVHDFTRHEDTFAVRANRLTAGLQKLCVDKGYEFVDVDRTVAEIGAAEHAPEPDQFSEKAARFVTEDVVKAVTAGAGSGEVEVPLVSVLRVPDVDARARTGRIRAWRAEAGHEAEAESPLVQIAFRVGGARRGDDVSDAGWLRRRAHRRRSENHKRRAGMTIDIKTAGAVSVAEILARTGDEVVVGQPIAVLTRDGSQPPDDTTNLPDLPATIEVAKR